MFSLQLIAYSGLVLLIALLSNFYSDSDVILAEKRVLLSKTVQEAFTAVGDLEKLSEWYPGTAGFMEIESGPKTRGKRYRETVNIPGIGNLYYVHTLKNYDPPYTIELVDNSWMHISYKIWFEVSEPYHSQPRTMMNIQLASGVRTYWFQYVAYPIFRFIYDQRLRTAAFNIRFLVDKY